jgi:hypothetical protein
MKSAPRPLSALLAWTLWVLLALLPLRGVANVLMHVPADGHTAAVTGTATAAPCHGEAVSDEMPAHADSCTLCELCHGTALPGFVSTPGADRARPIWTAAPSMAPAAGLPSPFFRPPRA